MSSKRHEVPYVKNPQIYGIKLYKKEFIPETWRFFPAIDTGGVKYPKSDSNLCAPTLSMSIFHKAEFIRNRELLLNH